MVEPLITCPSCKTEIKLTESLAAPLLATTRKGYEDRLAAKDAEVANKAAQLDQQRHQLDEAKAQFDILVSTKVEAERQKIAALEAEKANKAAADAMDAKSRELADANNRLVEQGSKLAEAQKAQADFLKKSRELEDAQRELDLTVEKRVQDTIGEVRLKARQEAEDTLKLKVTEKEEQIAAMQRQIEELRRRAEQGSQQLQGEALELELEQALRAKFPMDMIEAVAKGDSGADVLHRIVGPIGQSCGAILWESKRTKNWSDGWLAKLRADQRNARADIAILVSSVRPKGLETFGLVDGIWIVEPRLAIPLVIALRNNLIEIAGVRQAQDGQQTKMELVYAYLTGPKFRHRFEAIIEKFTDMREDLDKERKLMMKQWAKREAQIETVLESTAGMYGDLQGIAGKALLDIEGMEIPLIEGE